MVINARQPHNELEIGIDGPKMRIDGLQLVSSLSLIDGHEHSALEGIRSDIEGMVYCGHTSDVEVHIGIERNTIGPYLSFDVGPMGMYTSKMVLKTKSGRSFRDLIDHHFSVFAGELGLPEDYIACFLVVPGDGKHGHDGHKGH